MIVEVELDDQDMVYLLVALKESCLHYLRERFEAAWEGWKWKEVAIAYILEDAQYSWVEVGYDGQDQYDLVVANGGFGLPDGTEWYWGLV